MNVKELIEKLSKYDSRLEVGLVNHAGFSSEIEDIGLYIGESKVFVLCGVYLLSSKGVGPNDLTFPMKRVEDEG